MPFSRYFRKFGRKFSRRYKRGTKRVSPTYSPWKATKVNPRSPDLKAITTTRTNAAASIATNVDGGILNLIGQGSDFNQRIGRRIYMSTLRLNFNLVAAIAATQSCRERVLVVYDKAPNEVNNTAAQIAGMVLRDPVTAIDNVTSLRNEGYINRFDILLDKVLNVPIQAAGITPLYSFNVSIRRPAVFTSDTTPDDSSDYQQGALWILCMSSATANPPGMAYDARLFFTDI